MKQGVLPLQHEGESRLKRLALSGPEFPEMETV